MSAIAVDDISKRYRLGRGPARIATTLSSAWKRKEPDDYHWALRNVSFDVQPGEALGIIGPNGSGKTTILKILSRVTYPTSGRLRVRGRLSALVELGAGFHPDLTGRDNIFLNAAILGLGKADVLARFDDIVDFAEIGKYLDTPIKRYSSGMYARLGFAVAAHVNPDVLLVDEVLAVGDYAFQQRCHTLMDTLRARGTALVFVSHDLDAIRRVCDRAVVLYRGAALYAGTQHEALAVYSNVIREAARGTDGDVPAEGGLAERVMTLDAEITDVTLHDEAGQPTFALRTGSRATVRVQVVFHTNVSHPIFGFFVSAQDGRRIYVTNTHWMGVTTNAFAAGDRCTVEFSWNVALLEGTYELGVDVPANALTHFHDRIERARACSVASPAGAEGLVDLNARVRFLGIVVH